MIFQYEHDLASQRAGNTWAISIKDGLKQKTDDPVVILNHVADAGWELVTAGFVFQEEGSKVRGKVIGHEQAMVQGRTVGYYLFRRCEENRRTEVSSIAGRLGRTRRALVRSVRP